MGKYYGIPFKVHRGVAHWDTPPPNIFKMVADAVIFHWFTLISGEEVGPDGFGWEIQWLLVFFYADYGIIPSPRSSCLQEVLDVLTGVFDRFSQQKNVRKMVEMVCHPCYMDIRHLEAA